MDSRHKSNKKNLSSSHFLPLLLSALLVLVIIVVALVYSSSKTSSNKSNSNSSSDEVVDKPISGASGLYLSPQSGTYASGSSLTLQVRENSHQTLVNAVQANLVYPADLLKLVKVNTNASKFKVQAENQTGNGFINLARGSTVALLGDQLIAQITFQPIMPGSASVSFASGSALVNASTHQSLTESLPAPATYTIQ